MDPNLRMEH